MLSLLSLHKVKLMRQQNTSAKGKKTVQIRLFEIDILLFFPPGSAEVNEVQSAASAVL